MAGLWEQHWKVFIACFSPAASLYKCSVAAQASSGSRPWLSSHCQWQKAQNSLWLAACLWLQAAFASFDYYYPRHSKGHLPSSNVLPRLYTIMMKTLTVTVHSGFYYTYWNNMWSCTIILHVTIIQCTIMLHIVSNNISKANKKTNTRKGNFIIENILKNRQIKEG